MADRRRVERIAYRLFRYAAAYCTDNRRYNFGIPPITVSDLPKDLQGPYRDSIGAIDADRPRFIQIVPFSPVQLAGLLEGDVLISLHEESTGKALQPSWTLDRPAQTMAVNGQLKLELLHGQEIKTVSLTPQLICNLKPVLDKDAGLSITVSRDTLTITSGLVSQIPNDDELAVLIAHQLAHWLLHTTNQVPETLQEQDADYLATYLAHAAGFNVSTFKEAWYRAGLNSGELRKDAIARVHPMTPSRALALNDTLQEIRAKTLAGKRILPEQSKLHKKFELGIYSPPPPSTEQTNSTPAAANDVDPRLYKVAEVPFLGSDGLAGYQRFLESPIRPRAFAIGLSEDGRSYWAYKSGANASSDALERCSLLAARGKCYLYVVDDKVVWNPETAKMQPSLSVPGGPGDPALKAPRASGYAAINDLKAVPVPDGKQAIYQAFLEKPSPRAIIVTEDGRLQYWQGPPALINALTFCERSSSPCWLYAVNDAVVWDSDPAKRISRRNQLTTQSGESQFLGE